MINKINTSEDMGEFTKAVFDSKEFFSDEVMKEFAECESSRSRLQFVNTHVPRYVTDFLRIEGSSTVLVNDNETEQESLPRDKTSTSSFMVPHKRFPTLSHSVSVEYQKDRGRFLKANKKEFQQAGAELCQAQLSLKLDSKNWDLANLSS